MQRSGTVTYNGHPLDDFVVERTSSYVDQNDNHIAELTVRETFDFAARCLNAGLGVQITYICFDRHLCCIGIVTSECIGNNHMLEQLQAVCLSCCSPCQLVSQCRNAFVKDHTPFAGGCAKS